MYQEGNLRPTGSVEDNDNPAYINLFPTPTAQAKAFALYLANRGLYWGSRTAAYPIKHGLTPCPSTL